MRCRAWGNVSASRSKLTPPAAPLRLSSRAVGKVSVHDAGSVAAEVWQLVVRVVAEAWPCGLSEVPGLLLEWDDWQRPRAGENSGARVAIERRGPGQFADALSRRAAHRDCLPRKRPPNNRCFAVNRAAEITRHALPLNEVRIWCPLRGHPTAAGCPDNVPATFPATSGNCPQTRPVHNRELSANSPGTGSG